VIDLADRTAVVTGGSSGIGRAIAIELASAGATVVVADIREAPRSGRESAESRIGDTDGTYAFVETDVSDPDAASTLIDATVDSFDGLDVLVNNAAVPPHEADIESLSLDAWQRVLDVNLTGVYLCSRAALPSLRESEAPRIINVASQLGFVGIAGRPAYCAAKAAVINLTRQLAIEYADVPILANAICPGLIETTRTEGFREDTETRAHFEDAVPIPYFGTPEDVGPLAAFLASDHARYINGESIVVDGGYLAK
jgi:NAD(P)-dependent dehydrogenase (short-subunit alcohol dehydrogenase family)